MSTISDSDLFLIERGGTQFKVSASNLMSTIQDTDLLLIARGNSQYKVTGSDVKGQLGGGGPDPNTVLVGPWTKYWSAYSGYTQQHMVGAWYYDAPSTAIFNGFTEDGSGGICVGPSTIAWFLGNSDQFTGLSSFEICWYNEVQVAGDYLVWTDSGSFINMFSQQDTNGNPGYFQGKHVYTRAQLNNMTTFYGFTVLPNYGTGDITYAGTQFTRLEYIKVNGKTLYDPGFTPA